MFTIMSLILTLFSVLILIFLHAIWLKIIEIEIYLFFHADGGRKGHRDCGSARMGTEKKISPWWVMGMGHNLGGGDGHHIEHRYIRDNVIP